MGKQIIIVKPKSLSDVDKKRLTDAGNIVIEHLHPDTVRIVQNITLPEIDGGILLRALVAGVNDDMRPQKTFVKILNDLLNTK